MAAKKPAEPVDEYADDPFGRQLADSIRANDALLNGLRYDIGQRTLRAQSGDGEFPSAFELAALKKLETQLDADRLYAQARRMTRRP